MGKKTAYIGIATLLFAALNVLFFLWTSSGTRTTFAWVAYAFTVFAFLVGCITTMKAKEDKDNFEFATGYLSILGLRYFTIQFVVSAVAILLQGLNKITSLYSTIFYTIFTLLLLYFVIRIVFYARADEATSAALKQQSQLHQYVQDCSRMLASLMPIVPADSKRSMQELYDVIRYSPNEVSPQGHALEPELFAGINKLAAILKEGEWECVEQEIQLLTAKAKQRNFSI